MNPIISSDTNKHTCTSIISASCVLWHGPDLNCIDSCKGDSMVDIIVKSASQICSLKDTLDMTTLQLDCLDDNCNGCQICSPTDRVLKNVLECIIKKYCLLKAQVDNLPTTPTGTVDCPTTFNIDVSCLEAIADESLPTSPTNDQILQLIANALCISNEELSTRITQLNIDLIACCNASGAAGTIPQVNSSCLFLGLKNIDEAYLLLDADYCGLRDTLGTDGDLATSFNPSGGCSTQINAYLGTTIGGATTLDESITNIYSVLCALSAKVAALESVQETCCQFNCDDIDIVMFGEVADVDTKLATLVFTFNGGLSLVGYTGADTGSTVTFTDKNGLFITYAVDIFDDLTYTDLALTGLDMSGSISITGNLKYSITDALLVVYNCNKCISGIITINSDCAVCDLTIAGGTTINLKITYVYNSNTSVIIITTTGVFYIPKGATITSIVDTSAVSPTITSSCSSLVIPSPAVAHCYRFAIPPHLFQNGIGGNTENEETDFYITGIISNNVRYTIAAHGVIASNLGVYAGDNVLYSPALGMCTSCGGTDPNALANNTDALTSKVAYSAGGVDYFYNAALAGVVNSLNLAIGVNNPTVKEFTSVCTDTCGGCMIYRFLHVSTYSATPPLLELTNKNLASTITTVAQIVGEEIIGNCFCEG